MPYICAMNHISIFKVEVRLVYEIERIRIGKELLDAKMFEEENERKCIMALRKAHKEEERRAREKIRQKLEEEKVGIER
ncbi:hypothetical protein RIF29_31330 [Crotalaria pallida]|uniref:Uncharacterized protein n=1 Tax=Crotalaria pallida TaxID=3830 RepID=A0AAN9EMC1_CROPI